MLELEILIGELLIIITIKLLWTNRNSREKDYTAYGDVNTGRQQQNRYYTDSDSNSLSFYKKDVLNYPFNTYYIKPKTEQPFWVCLTFVPMLHLVTKNVTDENH